VTHNLYVAAMHVAPLCPAPDPETFWSLLHDKAHWEFECFLMLIDNLLGIFVGGLIWRGWLKKHWDHHVHHDKIHSTKTDPLSVGSATEKHVHKTATSQK